VGSVRALASEDAAGAPADVRRSTAFIVISSELVRQGKEGDHQMHRRRSRCADD